MKVLIFFRSILSVIVFLFSTMVLACLGIIFNLLFSSRTIDNTIIQFWGQWTCLLFGISVKVKNIENLNKVKGAVILFNHSSFFDVFAICGFLRGVRFGAKIELFKIPIFAQAMRRLGTIPIARKNRDEVFKVYEEAQPRFALGEKFALSPEGGRFHSDDLAHFKTGPFVFALTSKVPIIPVVIHGAHECWPKGVLIPNTKSWTGTITVTVLDPIDTESYSFDQRRDLQHKVYEAMNFVWKKN